MIPKASQRAEGQDLATHLLNAFDNEYVELAEVRGAVASDLHGAFAEWEVQAAALTRCKNYLYSLSISPDQFQGELTRAQYADFIERVEDKLGLRGQPRAVVFHVKEGREHAHVVWSRIDAVNEKAIHQAFDHDKLMMVTRQFARDHGLALPDGYHRERGDGGSKTRPLTLYEKAQETETGLTKAERMAHVTEAWRRSDTPKAFVRALEDMGYILATGSRPYVLVDLYGTMNALPKLIDDRSVRTKDIRAFLERDFPPESLPTVEEAKALAASHRKAGEAFGKSQGQAAQLDALRKVQADRRQAVLREQTALAERQLRERSELSTQLRSERNVLRSAYVAEVRRVRSARARSRPTGLAAFLGRVTGVTLVIRQLHKLQDSRRHDRHLLAIDELAFRQRGVREGLQRRQEMQALDIQRRVRALDQVDERERKSLETTWLKRQRIKARAGHDHMPALELALKPPGRQAVPHKAMNRHISPVRQELREAFEAGQQRRSLVDLSATFEEAAASGETGGSAESGSAEDPKPAAPKRTRRQRQRRRDRDHDRDR